MLYNIKPLVTSLKKRIDFKKRNVYNKRQCRNNCQSAKSIHNFITLVAEKKIVNDYLIKKRHKLGT